MHGPAPLFLVVLLGAALVVAPTASHARAQETERREIPDYDGRPPPPPDPAEGALVVPRVLLAPLYVISEYGLRAPLREISTWIEREALVPSFYSFFTFGPRASIGVFPTAYYDAGFLPSAGVHAHWGDFLTRGNRISAHAAMWGIDWLSLFARDRLTVGPTSWIVRGGYLRRPDFLLDPGSLAGDAPSLARYAAESVDGELGYVVEPGHDRSQVGASIAARWARFSDGRFDDQPSVGEDAAQTGRPLPPGFADGYTVLALRGRAALDTREPVAVPSPGVRIAARGEISRAVQEPHTVTWLTVSGQALGATDVLGARRALSLSLDVSAILTRSPEFVPFDLTSDVGGNGPLAGFRPGQLRGLSTAALTLTYDWPVWLLLSARVFVATGGAFGHALEDFALDRLRLSFGLLLRALDVAEHPFEMGLGFGTDAFDRGTSVSSVRFFVGARNDL